MSRKQIELPEDTWRKLKAHAALRGQTLAGLLLDMAHEALSDRPSEPVVAVDAEQRAAATRITGHDSFAAYRPAPKIAKARR